MNYQSTFTDKNELVFHGFGKGGVVRKLSKTILVILVVIEFSLNFLYKN